ncbi:MAG: maleylpyruvate isomerase N-terminal domain-containing protein, partial [Acidimicrobiia bacterium]|nr:maleylpyruvate isomerase N-terminal domain-containing protein [Acidimicrobiia bacterium]
MAPVEEDVMDPWPMIEADRTALADYLSGLSADEWSAPSLCADWTVEEVAAHMLVIPTVSKPAIFFNFLGSGFNLDKFSAKMVARITDEKSREQIAAALGDAASSTSTPPGLKPM